MKHILSGLLAGFIFYLGIVYQAKETQNIIEKRALELKQKDCYDWQDIEYIVFGEIQE